MKREQETFPYIAHLLNGAEVEWKPLGEVAGYEQPTKYLVKSNNYNDVYPTPVLTAGKTFILGYTDEIEGVYKASVSPVIIFDDFTTANKWVDFDFKAKSSAMKMITSKNENEALLKYIYYWLNTLPNELIEGDHKRQWISNYANKKIPVPPLSVQQEIVRILDKFTQLEAELEAELDCRKRQYEYYRDKLLSFNEVVGGGSRALIFSDLQWKTLGDLGAFYGGLTGKSKNDFSNGNAKFISYMNVFSNIATNFKVNDFVKIGESENQNTIQYGDILFTGSSESLEECGMSSVVNEEVKENVYLNSFCFGYRFHNSELFLPNFLKFLFRSEKIRKQIVKTANGVTRFNVSKKKMEKIQIPIPPIEEQERIAGILDKFDTLVNSISEGLPREIELRRKK